MLEIKSILLLTRISCRKTMIAENRTTNTTSPYAALPRHEKIQSLEAGRTKLVYGEDLAVCPLILVGGLVQDLV